MRLEFYEEGDLHRGMFQVYLLIAVFLLGKSRSVPLKSNFQLPQVRRDEGKNESNETILFNGCISDNVSYRPGEEVPSLGPCETCVCQGSDIVCSMVKCQQNSGCRIIQQSGQCCPAYQCDCEYKARIYSNGERIFVPEDECQVCYCKGGEIMCTSITCYERDDCEPHFSPGQCCPKYDHCPVDSNRVSGNSVRSVNASLYSPKREMQPWPLTKSNTQSSISYDQANSSQNNPYPQTIKIVEILPTTPGYLNKPSEVSIVPRIKTNEQSEQKEENGSVTSITEESTVIPSTNRDSSTLPASSTSEVEHLQDTTPESIETNKEERFEAVPELIVSSPTPLPEEVEMVTGLSPLSDVSTSNPLAEEVDVVTGPSPLSDVSTSNPLAEEVEVVTGPSPQPDVSTPNPLAEEVEVLTGPSPQPDVSTSNPLAEEVEVVTGPSPQPDVSTPNPLAEEVEVLTGPSPQPDVSKPNPLAEEVEVLTGPSPQPDSQRFATIHPVQFLGKQLSSMQDETTIDSVTEMEGSGYDLLTGGLYEDYSSESPLFQNVENETEDGSSSEFNEGYKIETNSPSMFEAYTATESYNISKEYSSPEVLEIEQANMTYTESSEVLDSDDLANNSRGNLQLAPVFMSKNSESKESESDENSSEEVSVNTSNADNSSKIENHRISEGNSIRSNSEGKLTSTEDYMMHTSELPQCSESTTNLSEESMETTTNLNLIFADPIPGSTEPKVESEETPQEYASSEIKEKMTDYTLSISDEVIINSLPDKQRKTPRLSHLDLDKESTSQSTLNFPSVVKVQGLGYNQTNTPTETSLEENVTSMAKVGIYHPAKANELAGYLTVVDDKKNTSVVADKHISSHLLLTPHDLKKLAEILIHEKIMPPFMELKNTNITFDNTSDTNDDINPSTDNTSQDINTTESSGLKEMSELRNITNTGEGDILISEDEVVGNVVPTISKQTKESLLEDPNSSRQIRIPDNGSQKYSALLDDRDLLILENFFRRNIGLH